LLRTIKFFLSILILIACGNQQDNDIETYTLKRQDFLFTITETGELEAVNATRISAPLIPWDLGSLKITWLIEDGAEVKEGDVLVEFDKNEVQKNMEDAQAQLEIAQAELRKAQASQKSQIEEMIADLDIARLQHRIAQLTFELAGFQAEIERKKIELQLENAAIALKRAEEKIENQKNINQQEISKLKLQVSQEQTKFEEAVSTLEKLTVRAPSPGIAIIMKNRYTDIKFQTEDQVWRGLSLISLPDLSQMQSKVMINEVDISKIKLNQSAQVRMDAYPDTSFKAHVTSVASLARNKSRDSKIKIFDILLLLDEHDKNLIPGMTVSCEILVEKIADTLFIPLEAVFRNEQGPFVFVKKGTEFKAQPIITGKENDDYVIIAEGLQENDQVALVDPTPLGLSETQVELEKEES
jgi:RND family efflux transporter MFP subunit